MTWNSYCSPCADACWVMSVPVLEALAVLWEPLWPLNVLTHAYAPTESPSSLKLSHISCHNTTIHHPNRLGAFPWSSILTGLRLFATKPSSLAKVTLSLCFLCFWSVLRQQREKRQLPIVLESKRPGLPFSKERSWMRSRQWPLLPVRALRLGK